MRKKLTRTGNSLALVLDKRLLDRVGIDADTPLDVSTNGQVIVVSPVRARRRTARLKGIVAEGRVTKADVTGFVRRHGIPWTG